MPDTKTQVARVAQGITDAVDIERSRSNQSPRELAAARVAALVAAANAWAKDVPAISTDEQAARCEDLIVQCRLADQDVDKQRKDERKPYDLQIADVQQYYNPLLEQVTAAGGILKKLKGAWLALVSQRQEAARVKAAAEAKRAREDAEMAEASAAAGLGGAVQNVIAADAARKKAEEAVAAAQRADRAKPLVAGEISGRASGFRTEWSAEIIDVHAALDHYHDHTDIRVALQKAANADARRLKKQMQVPGIRVVSKQVV